MRGAHARVMLDLAERGAPELHGPHLVEWLNRFDAELDNVRQALAWAADHPAARGALGLRLAAALGWFWFMRGYWEEGRAHMDSARERAPEPAEAAEVAARARALIAAGYIALFRGEQATAIQQMDEGVALYERTDDRTGLAWALGSRAYATLHAGDPQAARALAQRGQAVAEGGGRPWAAAYCQFTAWWMATFVVRDPAQLAAIADDAVAACRRVGTNWLIPICLLGQAMTGLAAGNAARAEALLHEALALERPIGEKMVILFNLDTLAAAEVALGRVERAARLYGYVEALAETISYARSDPQMRANQEAGVAALHQQGDAAQVAGWWAEGRAMTPEQALEYALQPLPEPALA